MVNILVSLESFYDAQIQDVLNEGRLGQSSYKVDEMLVYGFQHCSQGSLLIELQKTMTLWNPSFTDESFLGIKRTCKKTLVDVVIENFYRAGKGEKIIPIFFCIDTKNNKYPLTVRNFLSKEKGVNSLITHAEIRRAYKLTHDLGVPSKVREIAKSSIFFVRTSLESAGQFFGMESVPAPWESSDFQHAWKERIASSFMHTIKPDSWRMDVTKAVYQRRACTG